jgi:hypothetical protein
VLTFVAYIVVAFAPLIAASPSRAASAAGPPAGPYFGQAPPGLAPVALAPGFVSTAATELAGTFSPDGTEFFFTRRPDARGSDNRLLYTRQVGGKWTVPAPAPFAGDFMEMESQFTPDGERLLFDSQRPRPDGETRRGTIWFSQRTATGWSEARYLQAPLNDTFAMYVSATRAGTLYFTGMAGRKAGICRCRVEASGYREVEFLDLVEPPLHAAHPFVAADESYLVFDAQEAVPGSKPDLFVSFRNPDGSWPKGTRLPASVNTTDGELCPGVTPAGRHLMFTRFGESGGDIYWVDFEIVRNLKPQAPTPPGR